MMNTNCELDLESDGILCAVEDGKSVVDPIAMMSDPQLSSSCKCLQPRPESNISKMCLALKHHQGLALINIPTSYERIVLNHPDGLQMNANIARLSSDEHVVCAESDGKTQVFCFLSSRSSDTTRDMTGQFKNDKHAAKMYFKYVKSNEYDMSYEIV